LGCHWKHSHRLTTQTEFLMPPIGSQGWPMALQAETTLFANLDFFTSLPRSKLPNRKFWPVFTDLFEQSEKRSIPKAHIGPTLLCSEVYHRSSVTNFLSFVEHYLNAPS
jgi:hypothetical protein